MKRKIILLIFLTIIITINLSEIILAKYSFNKEIIVGNVNIKQSKSLLIKYIDIETEKNIIENEILEGYIGKLYISLPKQIQGFVNVSSKNKVGIMSLNSKDIIHYYEKEGLYAKLYDTNEDDSGDTLVFNSIKNFTYNGTLVTDFENTDINEYQKNHLYDVEMGIYETPWNEKAGSDSSKQYYKNIKKVVILNTIKPLNMSTWFWKFPLEEIVGLEKIDTHNCKNMSMTFQLSNFSTIETLDLSTWDTKNVNNMIYMFSGDTKLKTIYASENFNTKNCIASSQMFFNCSSIVGGNGTTYNSFKNNKEYARIDKKGEPGYFTLK